jgi:hypothetical protein
MKPAMGTVAGNPTSTWVLPPITETLLNSGSCARFTLGDSAGALISPPIFRSEFQAPAAGYSSARHPQFIFRWTVDLERLSGLTNSALSVNFRSAYSALQIIGNCTPM